MDTLLTTKWEVRQGQQCPTQLCRMLMSCLTFAKQPSRLTAQPVGSQRPLKKKWALDGMVILKEQNIKEPHALNPGCVKPF